MRTDRQTGRKKAGRLLVPLFGSLVMVAGLQGGPALSAPSTHDSSTAQRIGGTSAAAAAPVISGFVPATGSVGTTVTINGSDFTDATSVKFLGPDVVWEKRASFTVVSSTQITATVPTGAQTGAIEVATPIGSATTDASEGGSGTFTVTYSVTVTNTGTGSGTITSSPSGISCGSACSADFNSQDYVTLTATPAPGSAFSGWPVEGCSGGGGSSGSCSFLIHGPKSMTVTFTATGIKDIAAYNYYFTPKAQVVPQSYTARWTIKQGTHSVTDVSGMRYFNSGPKPTGQTFLHIFTAAGTYRYRSTAAGDPSTMAGTVKVPLKVSPLSGGVATSYTVTWASSSAPESYFSDVAYRYKPCAKTTACTWTAWGNWKTNQTTAASASFTPTKGSGTYQLRARFGRSLVDSTTKKFSLWSAPVTVSVT